MPNWKIDKDAPGSPKEWEYFIAQVPKLREPKSRKDPRSAAGLRRERRRREKGRSAILWLPARGRVICSRIRVPPAGALRKALPVDHWIGRALEVILPDETRWRMVRPESLRAVSEKNKERLLKRAKELRALYWAWEAKGECYRQKAGLFDALTERLKRLKTT